MDICVVTYKNTADRIRPAVRDQDELWVRDNTHDNIGFGAGCNKLAARGTQPIILFVNPDGDPQAGCFDALERALLDDPALVAVEATLGPGWDRELEPEFLCGACFAVRRSAFEAVGGFDERLFMYIEDNEISYRLSLMGNFRREPTALFAHDSHPLTSLRLLHSYFRNELTVDGWKGRARPLGMLRGAALALQGRSWRTSITKLSGTISYLIWTRRWEAPQMPVIPGVADHVGVDRWTPRRGRR
jgi:GT2 family glycosyltransferase